jgi:PEP-CTERM motif
MASSRMSPGRGTAEANHFNLLDKDKGLWQILNPFGSTAITSLVFTADDTPKPADCKLPSPTCDNSDYSIALVQTTDVPEPTTLGLIGLGLLGLGGMMRRRRKLDAKNLATARV